MKVKRIIVGIGVISFLFMVVISLSYAWWTWSNSSSDNTNVVVTVGGATISYEAGTDITNNNLIPVSSKEKGIVKNITVNSTKTVYLDLYLDVTILPDSLKDQSFKYELVSGSKSVKMGNFSINKTGDSIPLLKSNEVNNTVKVYTLYIWIDGNMSNPSSMTSQTFRFTLRASAIDEEPPSVTIGNTKLLVNTGTPDFNTVAATDEGIYSAPDDYGTSYYFRGAVTNNYVKFAGFYWRIVRINGDSSIRMIYDGTSAYSNGESSADRGIGTSKFNPSIGDNAYVGYMYGTVGSSTYEETHANTNNSIIKTIIDTWYKTNIEDKGYSNKIADAIYCNDRSISTADSDYTGNGSATTKTAYKAYERNGINKSPSLLCNEKNDAFTVSDTKKGNGALTYSVGLITADEVIMAVGKNELNSQSHYLYTGQYFWTMSPSYFSGSSAIEFVVLSSGKLSYNGVLAAFGVRPVVSLSFDVRLSGTGTQSDPFVVE